MPSPGYADIISAVPPSVASIIEAEIPPLLWHYTSLEGFTGIVESKRIWATEIRFLNDETEFLHAVSVIRKAISELHTEQDNKLSLKELIEGVLDEAVKNGVLSKEFSNIFVTSFTLHGDQLSQWRGYAAGGRGVSLGF